MLTTKCSYCEEDINVNTSKCPYCGESVKNTSSSTENNPTPEAEETFPLLKKQNFVLAIAVSATLIMLAIAIMLFLLKYDTLRSSTKSWMGLIFIAGCLLNERFIYMLGKYIQNFNVPKTFGSLISALRILSVSILGVLILGTVCTFAGSITLGILLISLSGYAAIAAYILFVIVGRYIWKLFGDDFVGGTAPLGFTMFYGVIASLIFYNSPVVALCIVWLLTPFFAIRVFMNAKKYSEEYGFKGE